MEGTPKIPGHAWANRVRAIRLGRPGGRTRTWFRIGWTAVQNVANGGSDRAAAMAYYAVQSVFPGILVVALIALLLSSPATVDSAVDWVVKEGLDRSVANALNTTLQAAAKKAHGGVGIAVVIAGLTSLQSASGWLAACGRAIEPDPDRRRKRGPIRRRIRFACWTLVLLTLLVLSLVALSVGGGLADTVFGWFGSNGTPLVWQVVRVPLVAGLIVGAMALLYRVAPDRLHKQPWREIWPGAIIAGVGWVVVTGAFAFYVRNLATLGATYGTFATPIILLLWLWLSGVVTLLGAEINAELMRRRYGTHSVIRLVGADDPEIAGHPAGVMPEADPAEDEALRHED